MPDTSNVHSAEEMPVKLNLGCGRFPKEGYLNVDVDPSKNPDRIIDLDQTPYPLPGEHFNLIEADHVLEHLRDPFAAMRELHRICRDGARVIIRTPHFSRGFTHPEHKRGFDIWFPLFFDPSFQAAYTGIRFDSESVRLRWFAQRYLKRTELSKGAYLAGMTFGAVADFFANLSPMICSRLWCYLVGGFEEVEFTLVCRK